MGCIPSKEEAQSGYDIIEIISTSNDPAVLREQVPAEVMMPQEGALQAAALQPLIVEAVIIEQVDDDHAVDSLFQGNMEHFGVPAVGPTIIPDGAEVLDVFEDPRSRRRIADLMAFLLHMDFLLQNLVLLLVLFLIVQQSLLVSKNCEQEKSSKAKSCKAWKQQSCNPKQVHH